MVVRQTDQLLSVCGSVDAEVVPVDIRSSVCRSGILLVSSAVLILVEVQINRNNMMPFVPPPPLSLSPPRCSDCGSGPAVPDHPRPHSELHPPSAAPGVDHRALLHRVGHHFPQCHLWFVGDVTLALRGRPLCPMDCLHGEYVVTDRLLSLSPSLLSAA